MAARYLLDSNALIAVLKGDAEATHAPLRNRLVGLATERLCLSAIVLAELLTGVEKSRDALLARRKVTALIQGMEVLSFDAADAATYASIRAALERRGAPIGPLDTLIAAQAVARGLVLVTANLREFERVPGLVCENWLK